MRQKDHDFKAKDEESSTRLFYVTCSLLAHPGLYNETYGIYTMKEIKGKVENGRKGRREGCGDGVKGGRGKEQGEIN